MENKEDKTKEEKDLLDYHPVPMTEVERFISELIPQISSVMGLEELNYYYRTVPVGIYYRTVPVGISVTSGNEKADGAVLAMELQKDYKSFYLTVCPEAVRYYKEGKNSLILRALVHELSHSITDELATLAQTRYASKKLIQGSVEETTEKIAMLVRKLLFKIDPKKFTF